MPASFKAEGAPFITAVLAGVAVPAGMFFFFIVLLIGNKKPSLHAGDFNKGHLIYPVLLFYYYQS